MIRTFFVPGQARPQGDLKLGRQGRLFMAGPVKEWRVDIGKIARSEIGEPLTGPVTVLLEFVFQPPRVALSRRGPHAQRPDLDKLTRACLDALTGIAYRDDSQVAVIVARKRWGLEPGVSVTVGPWDLFGVRVWAEQEPIGV